MKMVFLKKNLLMTLLMAVGSFVFLGSASDARATDKVVFSAISYEGPDETDCYKIYTMDSDGSNITRVGDLPCGGSGNGQRNPIWTHYGTKIMFTADGDCEASGGVAGATRIMSMDADGSNPTRLTPCEYSGHIQDLDWTPEETGLASISTLGQFVIVFMLGGISALWMTRRNSRVVVE